MSKKPVKFNPVVFDNRDNPYCTLCDSGDCDHTKLALYLQQKEAADGGHRFWCPSCASRDTQILPDGSLKCWHCLKVSPK